MALTTDLRKSKKPVASQGLFNAAGGKSFTDWQKTATPDSSMPSIAPQQVDDSMANKVNQITSQSSPLMQAAKTEGMKLANRRGLMNSSMGVGAAQDAMLKYATPIASQDASQDFQRNQAARGFEYNMALGDQQRSSTERLAGEERALQERMQGREIGSTEKMAAAQRALEQSMQTAQISAADRQQVRDIASKEGLAAAERQLQDLMQRRGIESEERRQERSITSAEKMGFADIESREGVDAARRALEQTLQARQISATDKQQIRDVASREGMAAAERELQKLLSLIHI